METQNFFSNLRLAVNYLRATGLEVAADELEAVLTGAWTTSSEMIGELGLAIMRIEKRCDGRLPMEVQNIFRPAMQEIIKIWPSIRI